MTRGSLSLCQRILASVQSASIVLLLLILSGLGNHLSAQVPASGPKIWLQDNQSLTVRHTGPAAGVAAAQPVSMASGDIDGDGVADLVVGYSSPSSGLISIHRGNLDAFAPQSDASLQAVARGEFPSPFLPDAQTFSVPVTPDFLALGNFTGDGQRDLIIAARGSNTLYIFPGDGKGGFGAMQTVGVPGGVTSLAAGEFGPSAQFSTVLIGTAGVGKSASLVAMIGSVQGLNLLAAFPLSAAPSNFDFGNFGGGGNDAAFLAGGQISILRSSTLKIVPVSLPVTVSAFALGSFIFDRNGGAQIAVLAPDGSVQIAARSEFDPRSYSNEEFQVIRAARLRNEAPPLVPNTAFPANGWKIIESLPSVGTVPAGQNPVFFRSRISVNGADDVMWLNAGNSRMAVISHADIEQGAQTFAPGQVSIKPYTGTPLAGVAQRINVDGRMGVIAIHQGESAPSLSMPIPDPTFTVNTTADGVHPGACAAATPNQCTLREALLEANGDTVIVPAGTYTLTIPRVAGDCTGAHGALSVEHTVTIMGSVDGAGNPTSIVQAGTIAYNQGTPNGVDMVMNVNEDLATANCPVTSATATISNLVLQNGHNRGTHGNDGDGGCMEFDTGSLGTANLNLTNVILQNCDTTQGNGGGLASFNFEVATGTGQPTITSSTIQGNSAVDSSLPGPNTAVGGGIWISDPSRATITGSKILNNLATQTSGGSGFGGGIEQSSKGTPGQTPQTQIHSSTISGNKSAFQGGGMRALGNLLIDQGTVISNNQNGQNGAGAANGGGLFLNPGSALTQTLSKVTITGNSSTGTGGGIAAGAVGAGTVDIFFSRLAGNTAAVSGNNLENLGATVNATTSAITGSGQNWWGTNAASTTIHTTTGTTTFDPFIVLTHGATPNPIKINGTTTLTGDMKKDNHGTNITPGNLTVLVGLPITFDNPVLGSIPNAQPETIGAGVNATAPFNAGGTSGRGAANATVDQAVVGANTNLIASATDAAGTATITTVGTHNFTAGETVVISGVTPAGYNGTFIILATPTATTFTYTVAPGLGAGSGGLANVGIIILEPLKITKTFVPPTVAKNTASALDFAINNPNVMPVDANFTDTLPANVGTVPGSLVVSTPNGASNGCSPAGTLTATAGTGSISFTNTAQQVGSCTIAVNVQSSVDNLYNNSVTINSTAAGTGAQSTSSANLLVINPPTIAKAFGATSIPLNGTTSLTFTVSSTNQNETLSAISFTDTLPSGLVVATPNGLSTTCTGTTTATQGSGSVSLSGASLAPGASCTLAVNVQGTTAGVKNNSVTVSDTTAGTGNTATASITVVAPPTISKAFGAGSIPLNGSTTVTFTISNPNTTALGDLTGVAFSDTLPNTTGTLVVAAVPGVTNTCNGTVTAAAGTGVISLSGGTVAHNASCTLTVNVTGTAAGDANNTTGAITSTNGGTGLTSNTALLQIVAPPTISKAFGAANIPVNGTTTATFTITNPAVNTASEIGIAFSDTLTNGLQVASTPGVTNSCGGTVTAAANSTSISLTGGSIATPGTTCVVVVNVTGTQAGTVTNTTGAVSSTNGGTGATSNTATLIVVAPQTVTKQFGATKIPLNGTTSLTINITNPNSAIGLTGLAFTDNLPAGLVIATPNALNNTCGGTATATAGSGAVSLSGGTLAASASCTVSVNVQGTTAGDKSNSVVVSSTEGGNSATANASITVVGPAAISKAFGAASIPLSGTTTVSFTISNPNTSVNGDLTGVAFSDTLPASSGPGSATLLVAATPGVVNTCGGTVTATAGTGVISLSGASIAHNSTCTLTVNVTGTVAGDANNTTGAISSTEGGTGTASNTATLKVVAPPTISKAFGAAAISLNGTTTVTFTITNPAANTSAENGIAFSDTLTNGLQVASTPGVSNTCGGTVTAAANSTSISLTGGSIATPGATCTIVVNVTGTQSGTVTNTTGAISSTNGGTGATSNTATLIVASPATVTKSFGAAKIPLNGTTSLTINITNPNTNVTLNGLAFTDNLPAGLVIATPNALNNTCGGTATATAGSGALSLSGGTLAPSASCAVTVNVTGTTAGDKSNSVVVSSTEGGTSATASASITVVGPPAIAKAFGAASIPLNGTTSVTFTISNPNTSVNGDLSGVAFSDTLPVSSGPGSATLVVATPNGVANTCGGTVTATAGTGVISLSGASVAHNSTCTLTVNVTGTVEGDANNTTGAISSTEGGTGTASNTATLKVVAPPTISKAFGAASITLNGTTTLTFTITNLASNTSAENGIAFSDTLTNGLQVATTPGVTNSCGGTVTAAANSTSISLTGGSIATPGATCTIVVNVTGTQSGTVTNTTGAVSSTNGGTGATSNTATLTVASPATVTKSFGASKIPLNGTTSLTINITNPNTNVNLTGLSFTDNLPAGLVIAATPNLTNSCGGTATATAGSGAVSLSGGTVAASASCAVTVNVTGTTAGDKSNSVQVTSTEGGTSATASASITVVGPPAIAKAFGAASIPLNGTTSVTFTISNPNTSVNGDLSGVAFSDTLPVSSGVGSATLVVATPNGVANTCGGTVTATAGTGVISLSGASVAHNSSCTLTVNVTGTVAGDANNTTGAISSTEGGTGVTSNTATLKVVAPPSIAKVFVPSTIALNATTSLNFTITNPAANTTALTGVAFTDTLPTGLTVASGTSTVCGGTLTTTNPTGIALTGATVNTGTPCTFSVTVTGAAAGVYTNTTGNVTSTNGGTGNTANANLTVGQPPTITKAFGAASILLNASTSLTFNIANPNTNLPLTGVAFSDTLPAGLVVATPNGLSSTCGGTTTAAAGSGSISLTGGSLAANGSCTISLNVTGVQAGVQNNTTGAISANETGPGATSNTASITVIGPPGITKQFGAPSINLNAQTTLSFTITNPNPTVALAGVAFGDTLPAGLTVANPNGLTGSCGAGTITTGSVSGFSVVNLSGGTIAAGGSCTFSVNVVGTTGGHKVNTTGTVSSTNAGTGGTATATIDVEAPDPTIIKTHVGQFHRGQTGAQYLITVSNVGFGPTVGTVTVVDTLPVIGNPHNIVPTALSGTGWSCTLATLTCTRADALASGSSYPVITMTVNIPQDIVNNFTNTADVSGGGDVNPNNNHASDPVSLGPPLVITPHSTSASVKPGATTQFVFDLEDDDPTLGTVALGCSGLPAGTVCTFNPPATSQPLSQVTMTITTSNGASNVFSSHNFSGPNPPLYAALMFPVLGFVAMIFGGRKNKKNRKPRLRLAFAFAGLAMLMALAGCGGLHRTTTPDGTFSITVTAATTTVQATTQVNLTVQ